jgi:tetratricopeptide (TPR) repeat protein
MTNAERFERAAGFEKQGDLAAAMKEYIAIVQADPSNRAACLNLGSIYFKMDRFEEAMKFYKHALSLGEDYISYFNMGTLHYKLGDYKQAVINLERSRRLDISFHLSSLVMGLCFSKMNDLKAAETNFLNVIVTDPSNRVAVTALAIIYFNEKRYDESLNLVDKLLLPDPENIRLLELKTTLLYRTGRIDESAGEIKNIAKISDGYRFFDRFISAVPVESFNDRYGTIDEKIDFLKERSADDRDSLISLSLCHLLKGETDTAIDRLLEAKKRSAY